VPGRSTVITQLQNARTTTYSDAARFRTVSRIARCIRSAVRLRICLTRASSIKAPVVYRTRPLRDRVIPIRMILAAAAWKQTPPENTPRLSLKPKAPIAGYADGGWWPHGDIQPHRMG
jgi:hypothetical protein